jgi:hypothetical protein
MDKNKYGVHASHCCIEHGCKYGDEDCPVVSGEIKQKYLCEYCDYDGIKSLDELYYPFWKKQLRKIEQCPQRQDSVTDQMIDLHYIANKFGFYDAADYIKRVFIENKK